MVHTKIMIYFLHGDIVVAAIERGVKLKVGSGYFAIDQEDILQ